VPRDLRFRTSFSELLCQFRLVTEFVALSKLVPVGLSLRHTLCHSLLRGQNLRSLLCLQCCSSCVPQFTTSLAVVCLTIQLGVAWLQFPNRGLKTILLCPRSPLQGQTVTTGGQWASQSWCQTPSGPQDQIFATAIQWRFCECEHPLRREDGSVTTVQISGACILYVSRAWMPTTYLQFASNPSTCACVFFFFFCNMHTVCVSPGLA
jgi:hypothetical protein